jgi:hypothetical protein
MEKDLEKAQRLNEVYKYVFAHFDIKSQKDFADFLHVQRTGLSAAMNGSKANLTKNLFTKICAAFPGVFNLDYLLTGNGSLLTSKEIVSDDTTNNNTTNPDVDWQKLALETMKSQMADLRMQLVDKQNIIESQKRTIELLEIQINGLKMEMKMKGLSTYPFTMGVSEKISAPEK